MENKKNIVISVSGAAEVSHCGNEVIDIAKEVGKEIAKQGAILSTGATSGFPYFSCLGYQQEKGKFSFGFSPAANLKEHKELYFLPEDGCDLIVYTGFGFPMRDIILIKSSDAVVLGCGRIGTIHEFTVAFEENIPVGILEGSWATSQDIKDLIRDSNRINNNIIFDSNPKRLVERLIKMAEDKKDRKIFGDNGMVEMIKAKV